MPVLSYSSFLNSRSNALRASLEFRGASWYGWGRSRTAVGIPAGASRATVSRGAKSVQSFALSLTGIRTGIGFMHWNRVEGSKCEHCLQQCSSALHLGQFPAKLTPLGRGVEQL